MTATRQLSQLIVDTKADSLPDWVFHESKRTLVNILAIGISASNAAPVRAFTEWAKAEGSTGRATVMASGLRTSPTTAALLNGYMAHLQDYDDTHFPSVLHPTAPVWPAVFALAEDMGASGRDALAAFAIGAEVDQSRSPRSFDRIRRARLASALSFTAGRAFGKLSSFW